MKTVPNIHLHKLINTMLVASSKIQYPKIKLELPNNQPIVLKLASAAARFPRAVNIDDGKPKGESKWFGRVLKTGELQLSSLGESIENELVPLLISFNDHPDMIAKIYGQKYGHCCFCGLTLTNADSVAAGYGPVCAENYGLPWFGMKKIKRDEEIETAITEGFQLKTEVQDTIQKNSYIKILNSVDKILCLWHDNKLSPEETHKQIQEVLK